MKLFIKISHLTILKHLVWIFSFIFDPVDHLFHCFRSFRHLIFGFHEHLANLVVEVSMWLYEHSWVGSRVGCVCNQMLCNLVACWESLEAQLVVQLSYMVLQICLKFEEVWSCNFETCTFPMLNPEGNSTSVSDDTGCIRGVLTWGY